MNKVYNTLETYFYTFYTSKMLHYRNGYQLYYYCRETSMHIIFYTCNITSYLNYNLLYILYIKHTTTRKLQILNKVYNTLETYFYTFYTSKMLHYRNGYQLYYYCRETSTLVMHIIFYTCNITSYLNYNLLKIYLSLLPIQ